MGHGDAAVLVLEDIMNLLQERLGHERSPWNVCPLGTFLDSSGRCLPTTVTPRPRAWHCQMLEMPVGRARCDTSVICSWGRDSQEQVHKSLIKVMVACDQFHEEVRGV